MAASIPGHIASGLLSRLRELEGRLVPFIRQVVTVSASEAVDIAQDTAQGILDDVTKTLKDLQGTIEKNAPDAK